MAEPAVHQCRKEFDRWRRSFRESPLSPEAKLILHTIGDHYWFQDRDGQPIRRADINQDTIAKQSSLSKKTVIKCIDILKRLGWITVQKFGEGLSWKRNVYDFGRDLPEIVQNTRTWASSQPKKGFRGERKVRQKRRGGELHSPPLAGEAGEPDSLRLAPQAGESASPQGGESDSKMVVNPIHSSPGISLEESPGSSSSKSSHVGKGSQPKPPKRTMTTTETVPKLLVEELVGKPLSPTGEAYDAEMVAQLWKRCRENDPACTPAAVMVALNAKIKVNHFNKGRTIRSWVGFLNVAVPKTFLRRVS